MANLQDLFDEQANRHHPWSCYAHVKGMQGKKHKDETRARMSDSHKVKTYKHSAETIASIKAKNKAHWPSVMTPQGVFPSVKSAAATAGVHLVTFQRWMQKYPEQYYYIKEA
jgi:hypothetical protein